MPSDDSGIKTALEELRSRWDTTVQALLSLRDAVLKVYKVVATLDESVKLLERRVDSMDRTLAAQVQPVTELAAADAAEKAIVVERTKAAIEAEGARSKAWAEAVQAFTRSPLAYAGAIGVVVLVIKLAFVGTPADLAKALVTFFGAKP